MFLLSYAFIAIVIVYIGLAIFLYKYTKKHFIEKKYIPKLVIAFFILLPTYDIIITNLLGGYYCLTTPSTFIGKKVEFPQSIYWEDNVYPGFNKEDRKLMIINYLDGVHLKTMALNGDDGKVYMYSLDKPIFKDLKYDKQYKNIYEQYAQIILKTQEVYTKQTMPKLNYTVTFNEVKLNTISRKFLYSDETKVIDNKTDEVIAQNQRVMKLFYNLLPAMPGQRYYQQKPMCGYQFLYAFIENKVFTNLRGKFVIKNVNEYLYNKKIKGKK